MFLTEVFERYLYIDDVRVSYAGQIKIDNL